MRYYVKTTEHVYVEFRDESGNTVHRKVSDYCWNHALYVVGSIGNKISIIEMGMLLRYIMKDSIKRTDAVAIILAAIDYKKHNQ